MPDVHIYISRLDEQRLRAIAEDRHTTVPDLVKRALEMLHEAHNEGVLLLGNSRSNLVRCASCERPIRAGTRIFKRFDNLLACSSGCKGAIDGRFQGWTQITC